MKNSNEKVKRPFIDDSAKHMSNKTGSEGAVGVRQKKPA
jgi:hypothetical protein